MNRCAYLHSLARLAHLFWNQVDRAPNTYGLVVKSVDGCQKAEITVLIHEPPQAAPEMTWYVKMFRKFPGGWQPDLEVKSFETSRCALDYAASQSCTERAGYLKA